MLVRVRAFATLADLVGTRSIELELPEGSTVGDALRALVQRCGRALEEAIMDEHGRPRKLVKIFLNGRDVDFLSGLSTPLSDGDELLLFPPVGGG